MSKKCVLPLQTRQIASWIVVQVLLPQLLAQREILNRRKVIQIAWSFRGNVQVPPRLG